MKTLIGMTDFVFKIGNLDETTHRENLASIYNYAKFLKQPLELRMFIPCDEDGNVLEKPKISCGSCEKCICSESYQINYQEAKERCLFEIISFENDSDNYWYFGKDELNLIAVDKSESIESLVEYKLTLTETAQKQLGWI